MGRTVIRAQVSGDDPDDVQQAAVDFFQAAFSALRRRERPPIRVQATVDRTWFEREQIEARVDYWPGNCDG